MVVWSRLLLGVGGVWMVAFGSHAHVLAQNVAGLWVSGEPVGLADGALPRVLVTGQAEGRTVLTAEAEIRRASGRNALLIAAAFSGRPHLANVESFRLDLISRPGEPNTITLRNVQCIPILDLPGFPIGGGLAGPNLAALSPPEVRGALGIPNFNTNLSELSFGARRPVTLRYSRQDMRGPTTKELRTRLSIGDGIRADSSMTLALQTYDGRLLEVESGQFRDNSRPMGTLSLPTPIGFSHFANLQAFFLRRRFENGGPLPAAPAFATGDDARFGFTLETVAGDRIHQFSSLTLQDTTNATFRFPTANQQMPAPFWADALSFWLQTGERGLSARVPVMVSLHFKGGFVHTARLPIVSMGFANATRPGGCGQFTVFLRDLRLPSSMGSGLIKKEETLQQSAPGFPIHALERISLSLIREGSTAPRDLLWDVKGLIITAGRASSQFPIWADGVNQVNLVCLPNWNKTFRMEGAQGPVNSSFQHSVTIALGTQSYTLTAVNE